MDASDDAREARSSSAPLLAPWSSSSGGGGSLDSSSSSSSRGPCKGCEGGGGGRSSSSSEGGGEGDAERRTVARGAAAYATGCGAPRGARAVPSGASDGREGGGRGGAACAGDRNAGCTASKNGSGGGSAERTTDRRRTTPSTDRGSCCMPPLVDGRRDPVDPVATDDAVDDVDDCDGLRPDGGVAIPCPPPTPLPTPCPPRPQPPPPPPPPPPLAELVRRKDMVSACVPLHLAGRGRGGWGRAERNSRRRDVRGTRMEGALRLDSASAVASQAQVGAVLVGEDRVAMAVGNSVVVQHVVTRKQTVLVRGGDRGAVTALAASPWAGYVFGRGERASVGGMGSLAARRREARGWRASCRAGCWWWRRRGALRW